MSRNTIKTSNPAGRPRRPPGAGAMTAPARTRALSDRRPVRVARRAGVAALGTTLLGTGAALLVLPGPGLLVVVTGLALLATEFAWAERRLHQVRSHAARAARAARPSRHRIRPIPHERSNA